MLHNICSLTLARSLMYNNAQLRIDSICMYNYLCHRRSVTPSFDDSGNTFSEKFSGVIIISKLVEQMGKKFTEKILQVVNNPTIFTTEDIQLSHVLASRTASSSNPSVRRYH